MRDIAGSKRIKLVTKTELDIEFARLAGLPRREAGQLSALYLQVLSSHLAALHSIQLPGLGRFNISVSTTRKLNMFKQGIRKIRVSFAKSDPLRDAHKQRSKELDMEKYGVDENVDQQQLEKQSAQGCPKCGRTPTRHGALLMCPNCGSEPFEARSTGNGSKEESQ